MITPINRSDCAKALLFWAMYMDVEEVCPPLLLISEKERAQDKISFVTVATIKIPVALKLGTQLTLTMLKLIFTVQFH